jgi:hypothetical protein
LVLFQIGVIGEHRVRGRGATCEPRGLGALAEALLECYTPGHRVAAYVAAQHIIERPRIDWIELGRLEAATIDYVATLYVPPACEREPNDAMVRRLNLTLEPRGGWRRADQA